jgi:hypothetical protein
MTTVVLRLSSDTERRLRARAVLSGTTLEGYLEQLAQRDVERDDVAGPGVVPAASIPEQEFEHLLDQLAGADTLPQLPADFSRSDIYADHD